MSSAKKFLKCIIYLAAAALLLELAIGNFLHWKTLSYTPVSVPFDRPEDSDGSTALLIPADPHYRNIGIDAYVTDGSETWNNSMGESYTTITSHVTDVTLSALDADGRLLCTVAKQRIGSRPGTMEYIFFHLPPHAKYLDISFEGVTGTDIVCNSLCYDGRIPLRLSPLRIVIFFLLLSFFKLFIVRNHVPDVPLFLGSQSRPETVFIAAAGTALFLNVLLILLLIAVNPVYWKGNTGFEPYVYLARALEKGQTAVDLEVSEELLAMDNPYDAAARSIHGVKFALDYAYYEGQYYVYFGIVPCLMLYLPYRLLTGTDLPNWCAVAFFATLFATAAACLLYVLCKRYFPSVTRKFFFLEYGLLMTGSMLFYVLSDSGSYCIPMIAALAFAVSGAACWTYAGDPSCARPGRWIALGSLLTALCAGCRPHLVFSAILAYPLLRGVMLPKEAIRRSRSITPRSMLRRWICFLLPFLITAVPLMYYNYIRFGSVAEFGAKYNLTSTNVHEMLFSFERIPYGIFYYLLQVPRLSADFPFLQNAGNTLGFPGVMNFRNGYGGMLLWNLPLWSIFFFQIADKKTPDRSRKDLALLQRSLTVLGVFYLMLVTGMGAGGLIYRYGIDFAFLLSLSAALLQLAIHTEKTSSGDACPYQDVLLAICLLIAFGFQIASYLGGDLWPLRDAAPDLYDRLADIVTFWK